MNDSAPDIASARLLPADPYSPAQMAQLVEAAGIRKASQSLASTFTLALLAGAFIAFGGMLFTLVVADSALGMGPTRVLGGLCFSLGLVLVIIGGAELFTGNNLIVMAWADRKVRTPALLKNWGLVYLGNFVGSLGCVILVYLSGTLAQGNGAVGETAAAIALAKTQLGPLECLVRGILCNVLVCLAVWLTFASHSVSGKILAIVFPITAFVALGFEHSIANMYLLPIGMLASGQGVDPVAMLGNLVPVTVGNIIGGGVFVALVYWVVYLRQTPATASND